MPRLNTAVGFNNARTGNQAIPSEPFLPESFSSQLVFWGTPESLHTVNVAGQDYTDYWTNTAATGTNYNFIFNSASFAPYYVSSGVNGYPSAQWIGSNGQYLEQGANGLDLAKNVNGLTIAVAFQPTYPTVDPRTVLYISGNTSASLARFHCGIYDTAGNRFSQGQRTDAAGYSIYTDTAEPSAQAGWDIYRVDFSNAGTSALNNGLLIKQLTTFSDAGTTTNANSSAIMLGALNTGSYPFSGYMAELLVWRGGITPTELGKVNYYFARKYGNFQAPKSKDYFFLIGDSNISGLGLTAGQELHNQINALAHPDSGITNVFYNYGYPGLKMTELMTYVENNFHLSGLFCPNARNVNLVIGGGGNDVFASDTTANIINACDALVQKYKACPAKMRVYPWTTPPLDSTWNAAVTNVVTAMNAQWRSLGWTGLVPANEAVLAPPSVDFQVDNTHFASDGLPSTVGVGKAAQAVVNTIHL